MSETKSWRPEDWSTTYYHAHAKYPGKAALTEEVERYWLEAGADAIFEALNLQVKKLTSREKQILRLRYFEYGSRRTLQEVAVELGITKERVRQLETRAVKKVYKLMEIFGAPE